MKRFTLLFTILGVLAFSAFFQAWAESRAEAKNASGPAKVYDATGVMLEAINPKSSELRISPVYDSTGAMLDAINPKEAKVTLPLVYDATGAVLDATNPKEAEETIPSVYDATGAGAMLDAINP